MTGTHENKDLGNNFDFDRDLTLKVREAFNTRQKFISEKLQQQKVFDLRKKPNISFFNSGDRIIAAITRIEDTMEYLSGMDLKQGPKLKGAFTFFNFINNMTIVIDCIKALLRNFDRENVVLKIENDSSIFNQKGLDGTGGDGEYFRFVRSLVAVHPLETSLHPTFHGENKYYCSPFADWDKYSIINGKYTQIYVQVYDPVTGEILSFPLFLSEFYQYLLTWYGLLGEVVDGMENYSNSIVSQLKNVRIKTPDEYSTYPEYLRSINEEKMRREDNYRDYILDNYIHLFQVKLTNPVNEIKLKLYLNAIEYAMKFKHTKLQNLDNEDRINTGITFNEKRYSGELYEELWYLENPEVKIFRYELEKVQSLADENNANERYWARMQLERMRGWISNYLDFSGQEDDFESLVILKTALYLSCLNNQCLINRNIPNDLAYRQVLLSPEALSELYSSQI